MLEPHMVSFTWNDSCFFCPLANYIHMKTRFCITWNKNQKSWTSYVLVLKQKSEILNFLCIGSALFVHLTFLNFNVKISSLLAHLLPNPPPSVHLHYNSNPLLDALENIFFCTLFRAFNFFISFILSNFSKFILKSTQIFSLYSCLWLQNSFCGDFWSDYKYSYLESKL